LDHCFPVSEGFDLGLERAGFEIKWQVENDPYCNRVLAKHWPHVKRYGDIRGIDWRTIPRVDLLCGGFPCQPFSLAGQRRGTADDRYLWPEMRLAVLHAEPTWVIAENVPGLIGPALDEVLSDLEAAGYEVGTLAVPACAVGAPHIRQRIWILAYRDRSRRSEDPAEPGYDGAHRHVADAEGQPERAGLCPDASRGERRGRSGDGGGEDDSDSDEQPMGWATESRSQCGHGPTQSSLGMLADGLPDGLVRWSREPEDILRTAAGVKDRTEQLKGLGNAVVPQLAEWLGRQIMKVSLC